MNSTVRRDIMLVLLAIVIGCSVQAGMTVNVYSGTYLDGGTWHNGGGLAWNWGGVEYWGKPVLFLCLADRSTGKRVFYPLAMLLPALVVDC